MILKHVLPTTATHFFTLFFLYAEIHLRLLKLPGRLYQRWPEILADVPHRIEPGRKIPILVICKDAHHFPVTLIKIRLELRGKQYEPQKIVLSDEPQILNQRWWDKIFYIEPPKNIGSEFLIDVFVEVIKKRRRKTIQNDNYKHSSHASFKIRLAKTSLPAFPNQYSGDLHSHSNFTNDQVEFGASLHSMRTMAAAMGFSFVAVTDHSYDLDDKPDNYLINDKKLTKWKMLHEETGQLNRERTDHPVVLIPGEEVSVSNRLGRNVHFLIINANKFYTGSGDSGERWFQTRAQWSLPGFLTDLEDGALALAPHPFIKKPLLESVFLHRGSMSLDDVDHERIDGLQILNGVKNPAFYRGLRYWRRLLLKGERMFIYAGNDAHGNFNYYRQIRVPLWSIAEKNHYVFGKVRTVLALPERPSLPAITAALKSGNCYITDGPAIDFFATGEKQTHIPMGSKLTGEKGKIRLSVKSTPEFGTIKKIVIYHGKFRERKESKFKEIALQNCFSHSQEFSFTIRQKGYLRIHVVSTTADKEFDAYSNPIWLEPAQG